MDFGFCAAHRYRYGELFAQVSICVSSAAQRHQHCKTTFSLIYVGAMFSSTLLTVVECLLSDPDPENKCSYTFSIVGPHSSNAITYLVLIKL